MCLTHKVVSFFRPLLLDFKIHLLCILTLNVHTHARIPAHTHTLCHDTHCAMTSWTIAQSSIFLFTFRINRLALSVDIIGFRIYKPQLSIIFAKLFQKLIGHSMKGHTNIPYFLLIYFLFISHT